MAKIHEIARAQRINIAGALAILSTASTAPIVVVARADRVEGARLGMALAGVVALICGLSVIGFSWTRRHRNLARERPRMLLGVGFVVWGAGQFLLGLQITPTGERTFGAGDIVSTCCLPCFLLALISMPRRSRVSRPALRLTLDTMILTSAIVLALWWVLLQPALPDPKHPGTSALTAVVMASCDVGVAGMTALIWIRDRRRGWAAVAIGLTLQAIADISSMPAVVGNHPLPWLSGAIWCVGIPLLTAGVISYASAPVSDGAETLVEDLGESRATMLSTVVSLIVLATAVAAPIPHRWTPISITLSAITVTLLLARETTSSLVRNRMVRWLNTEALRDVLTGLPNRSALAARIRNLDLAKPWVLLTVDLDSFKEVNDLLGSQAGDELIMLVGATLRRHSPPQCLVARMDGDEFGVLAAGTVEEGEQLARHLSQAIRRTVRERSGVALSASIGVGRVMPESSAPSGHAGDTDDQPDRLNALLESEAALRAAKAAGRDQIALYPGAVEEARRRRLLLERRLRTAIETGALGMHAQPLVDLRTGRVAGFESLARWTDEVLGPVSPVEFIPIAEQTGLITSLGEFALRNTLLQAHAGGVVGQDVEIGVNVSPIQLRDRNFAPMVLDLIAELGLEPGQLLLEVTEAILVADGDPASSALAQLANAGIQLAIDDFGTGYSALSYLRWLPVEVIKIDRSWVVASVTDGRTRDIVSGVVSLAHELGAIVVMEGIEDDATAQMCRALGADLGQGFLFGRPMPWPLAAAELSSDPAVGVVAADTSRAARYAVAAVTHRHRSLGTIPARRSA